MDVLFLLIPIALILVVIIGWALFWAIRSGQFEDMEGPAHRILMDEEDPRIPHAPPPASSVQPASPATPPTPPDRP